MRKSNNPTWEFLQSNVGGTRVIIGDRLREMREQKELLHSLSAGLFRLRLFGSLGGSSPS